MATAYSTAKGPVRLDSGFLSQRNANESGANANDGGALWSWVSTAGTTNLSASNFISDAQKRGMREGDIVMCCSLDSTGAADAFHIGMLSPISTAGAANVIRGTMLLSTTV